MASPRTRRLVTDAESIRKRLFGWPLIEITGTAGIPPEIYRFTYRIQGLYVDPNGTILERDTHLLEVNLSRLHPRGNAAGECGGLHPGILAGTGGSALGEPGSSIRFRSMDREDRHLGLSLIPAIQSGAGNPLGTPHPPRGALKRFWGIL